MYKSKTWFTRMESKATEGGFDFEVITLDTTHDDHRKARVQNISSLKMIAETRFDTLTVTGRPKYKLSNNMHHTTTATNRPKAQASKECASYKNSNKSSKSINSQSLCIIQRQQQIAQNHKLPFSMNLQVESDQWFRSRDVSVKSCGCEALQEPHAGQSIS